MIGSLQRIGRMAAIGIAMLSASAFAETIYHIDDPRGRNVVSFKSEAPLEDMVGTSPVVNGDIRFDAAKPETTSGQVIVPVKDLKTGIPLRDEHMMGEAWLDAAKHPEIKFVIKSAKDAKLTKETADFKTWDIVLVGDFTLKGITKEMEIPARLTWLKQTEATQKRRAGDLLALRAAWQVKLSDFDIKGMGDTIGTKISEVIDCEVSFVAGTEKIEAK